MKNRVLFLLTAVLLAAVLTVSVFANDGNLGDTDPGREDEWIGDADGMIDGTDSAEKDGGLMEEITDALMGDTGGREGGTGSGDSGTGMQGGSGSMGDTTGGAGSGTGAVTGDPGTDSGSSSVDGASDDGMSVFGIVIVILIVLAVIALVIVLMPKRK